MLKNKTDPTLHCIGLAIGHTTNNSCIVTPIEDVLKSFNLTKGFVKSIGTYIPVESSASTSKPELNLEQSFEDKMMDLLQSMKSDMKDVKAVRSDVTVVKHSVGQLEKSIDKLETDNFHIKKSIQELQESVMDDDHQNQQPNTKKRKL